MIQHMTLPDVDRSIIKLIDELSLSAECIDGLFEGVEGERQ